MRNINSLSSKSKTVPQNSSFSLDIVIIISYVSLLQLGTLCILTLARVSVYIHSVMQTFEAYILVPQIFRVSFWLITDTKLIFLNNE